MSAAPILDEVLADLDSQVWPLESRAATTDELASLTRKVASVARVLRAIVKRTPSSGFLSTGERWAAGVVVGELQSLQGRLSGNDQHAEAALISRIINELLAT